MIFTQYYLECLSQASYLIGDEDSGQAVVVDPRRDVTEYLADAGGLGLRIVGVINTHFHADFLAGHLELAALTGAWIGYGPRAATEYQIRHLADGERISLGDATLQIMQTPGHTPESISVLVFEHADDPAPYGVLTGDALFIGDVGRPDLLASSGVSAAELGHQLYESVQHKLMALPDEVRVFPAHGAGSACGKNLSTERQSTIGAQRLTNYACWPMSESEFLGIVTADQPPAPEYFGYDAELNRRRHELFDPDSRPAALCTEEFLASRKAGAVVVDARGARDFAAGHLSGALNVPADGRFAETAGSVLRPEQDLLVVAPSGREEEIVMRLARIGFDHVVGYLDNAEGVFDELAGDVEPASRLTAAALRDALAGSEPPFVLDVRTPSEREEGAINGSGHIPLAELAGRIDEVPRHRPVVVLCAGGYRSSVAASLLRRAGHSDVSDLLGGFAAWTPAHDESAAPSR